VVQDTVDQREGDRRAAAAYLRTAITSGDAAERRALRRRAAELILPRGKRGPETPLPRRSSR
jgi:hypothetical protein